MEKAFPSNRFTLVPAKSRKVTLSLYSESAAVSSKAGRFCAGEAGKPFKILFTTIDKVYIIKENDTFFLSNINR